MEASEDGTEQYIAELIDRVDGHMAVSRMCSSVDVDIATERVLTDPDLLFVICTHIHDKSMHALTLTSCAFRATTLRPDAPFWRECTLRRYELLNPPIAETRLHKLYAATTARLQTRHENPAFWDCEHIRRILLTKHVTSLDLSLCQVPSRAAAASMITAIPDSLSRLVIDEFNSQPDVLLYALLQQPCSGVSVAPLPNLPRLSQLPMLTHLDLRGVCTERTLAGMRLLTKNGRLPRGSLAPTLPHLRAYAVGFHTHTALGVREGEAFLQAQRENAPKLQRIGCHVSCDALAEAIDLRCAVCGTVLFGGVTKYLIHPPQQPHISYEIHTDQPPIAEHVRPMREDGMGVAGVDALDETRLQCKQDCHPGLWVVDAGSHHVRHVLGHKYSIACGGPRGGYPPLAIATRAGTPMDATAPVKATAASGSDAAETSMPATTSNHDDIADRADDWEEEAGGGTVEPIELSTPPWSHIAHHDTFAPHLRF